MMAGLFGTGGGNKAVKAPDLMAERARSAAKALPSESMAQSRGAAGLVPSRSDIRARAPGRQQSIYGPQASSFTGTRNLTDDLMARIAALRVGRQAGVAAPAQRQAGVGSALKDLLAKPVEEEEEEGGNAEAGLRKMMSRGGIGGVMGAIGLGSLNGGFAKGIHPDNSLSKWLDL